MRLGWTASPLDRWLVLPTTNPSPEGSLFERPSGFEDSEGKRAIQAGKPNGVPSERCDVGETDYAGHSERGRLCCREGHPICQNGNSGAEDRQPRSTSPHTLRTRKSPASPLTRSSRLAKREAFDRAEPEPGTKTQPGYSSGCKHARGWGMDVAAG